MAARTLISLARHADVCASPWVWTMNKHAWVLVRMYVCMCSYGNSSNECALPQCNLLVASAAHEAQSLTQQWRSRSRLLCSFCKICAKSRTNLCIQHNANSHACMQALTQTHVNTHNSKWSHKWDETPCKSFFHWVTPWNVTPLKLQFRLLRRFDGTEGPWVQNKCVCACMLPAHFIIPSCCHSLQ